MFIIFALVALALEHTVWGRSVYLVGNNYIAALFSGVRTTKTIILTYMIGGLMCGFSALILISRVNSARIGYGDTYLLQAILVSVMGGINPKNREFPNNIKISGKPTTPRPPVIAIPTPV
jgi:simple sugar transport system permease protein